MPPSLKSTAHVVLARLLPAPAVADTTPKDRASAVLLQTTASRQRQHAWGAGTALLDWEPTQRRSFTITVPGLLALTLAWAADLITPPSSTTQPSPASEKPPIPLLHHRGIRVASFITENVLKAKADTKGTVPQLCTPSGMAGVKTSSRQLKLW